MKRLVVQGRVMTADADANQLSHALCHIKFQVSLTGQLRKGPEGGVVHNTVPQGANVCFVFVRNGFSERTGLPPHWLVGHPQLLRILC